MKDLRCIRENWFTVFKEEINKSSQLRIISPFIADSIVAPILDKIDGRNIHVITRYNLADFFSGVSQLVALENLVRSGAHIRGIKGLHSKMYTFDNRLTIISSANLTSGGLFNNYEFGIAISNRDVVRECNNYFNRLWKATHNDLTITLIEKWKRKIDNIRIEHQGLIRKFTLPDYGDEVSSEITDRHPQTLLEQDKHGFKSRKKRIISTRYFLKFFGTAENRVNWNFSVEDEIKRAESHYACAWPKGKRPRSISHGDVIFMARLTQKPNGHAIFGRAWGLPHVEGRDDATINEIKRCDWKKRWPHYIRVFDPVFIDGRMSDCIKLDDLMNKFGSESFISTSRNKQKRVGNINPRKALMQQACVELTPEAAIWLDENFSKVLSDIGRVTEEFINSLPRSDIQTGEISTFLETKNIWIFQANPGRYDIVSALRDETLIKDCWMINQYKNKVKKGDLALIWISGKEAGIYAAVEITSDPYFFIASQQSDKYWVNEEDRGKKRFRVEVGHQINLLNNPVFKDEVKNIDGLEDLSILRQPQGINFAVTHKQWVIIREIIQKHLQELGSSLYLP